MTQSLSSRHMISGLSDKIIPLIEDETGNERNAGMKENKISISDVCIAQRERGRGRGRERERGK